MKLASAAACALAVMLAAGAGAATTQIGELSAGSIGPLARLLLHVGSSANELLPFDVLDDDEFVELFDLPDADADADLPRTARPPDPTR
jgi:hypothetical protein